jgi:MFS family permease
MPVETLVHRDERPAVDTLQDAHPLGCAAPVLDEEPRDAGRRLAAIVGRGHPLRTFLTGVALSFVSIATVSILLGLLVTRVIVPYGGIDGTDESLVRFLSHHRSGGLTDASLVGSILAGGVVLPIVVGLCGALAALFRQWRLGAFLIFALAVESGAYRATTLLVHRQRGLLRSCPRAHVADLKTRAARSDLDDRGSDPRVRRVRPHVPRYASPAGRRRRRRDRNRRARGDGVR